MKKHRKKLNIKRLFIFIFCSIPILIMIIFAFKKIFFRISTSMNLFKKNTVSENFISKKEKNILDKYNVLINQKPNSKEVTKFINKHINEFSKNNSAKLLLSYEDFQESKINEIKRYLSNTNNSKILYNELGNNFSTENIKKISNPDLKNYLESIYETGYKIVYINSYYVPKINYEFYNSYFNNTNTSTKNYFILMNTEQSLNIQLETNSLINWNKIKDMILSLEKYIDENSNLIRNKKIKKLYCNYIKLYTLGSTKFPTFDKNNILYPSLKDSYDSVLSTKPNTRLYDLIDGLLKILKSTNYSLNNTVEDYILDTIRDILN